MPNKLLLVVPVFSYYCGTTRGVTFYNIIWPMFVVDFTLLFVKSWHVRERRIVLGDDLKNRWYVGRRCLLTAYPLVLAYIPTCTWCLLTIAPPYYVLCDHSLALNCCLVRRYCPLEEEVKNVVVTLENSPIANNPPNPIICCIDGMTV